MPPGSHTAGSDGNAAVVVSAWVRMSTFVATEPAMSVHPVDAGLPLDEGQTCASARAQTEYTDGETSLASTDFHGPPARPSTTRPPLSLTTAVCASSRFCRRTVMVVSSGTEPATVPL